MLVMNFFPIVLLASYLGVVVGQLQNVTQALQAVPICAAPCLLPVLAQLDCSLATIPKIASCLCPNIAAQRNVSSCVQHHCILADQVAVVEVNAQLCMGYPIPSRSGEMENAAVALMVVVISFILLRLFAKIFIVKTLGWDDYTIVLAAIFAICIFVVELPMTKDGFGKHVWTIKPQNVSNVQLLFYVSQIFYVLTQVTTKISLILLYIRIFPQRLFRYAAFASIAIIGVHGFVFIFVVAFQCIPVYSIWHGAVPSQCLNKAAIVLAGAVSSICEDILVLVLPIPCIKSLQIKTGKRVSLIIMFSVGSFACITSIIRLRYIRGFGDFDDATWDNVDVFHWSSIEITTAIVCTCLPAVRNILSRLWPKIFGSLQSNSNTAKSGGWSMRSGVRRIDDVEHMDEPIVKDYNEFRRIDSPSTTGQKSPQQLATYEMHDMIHGRGLSQFRKHPSHG